MKIDKTSTSYIIYKIIVTFLLVSFAWIFFRANNLTDALYIVKNIFVPNFWVLTDSSLLNLGVDQKEFNIIILSIFILFFVDYKCRNEKIYDILLKKDTFTRYFIYFIFIFLIVIFGVYGNQYDSSSFIYFQF